MQKNTLCGRPLVRSGKNREITFVVVFGNGKGKNREKVSFEVSLLLGLGQNRESTLCSKPLVWVSAKIETTHVLVGLWLRVGQK